MELDHQAGRSLAPVFHVEDGDALGERRLFHPAQDAIAHIFAQEEEKRGLMVRPTAELVADTVQAWSTGGGRQ